MGGLGRGDHNEANKRRRRYRFECLAAALHLTRIGLHRGMVRDVELEPFARTVRLILCGVGAASGARATLRARLATRHTRRGRPEVLDGAANKVAKPSICTAPSGTRLIHRSSPAQRGPLCEPGPRSAQRRNRKKTTALGALRIRCLATARA